MVVFAHQSIQFKMMVFLWNLPSNFSRIAKLYCDQRRFGSPLNQRSKWHDSLGSVWERRIHSDTTNSSSSLSRLTLVLRVCCGNRYLIGSVWIRIRLMMLTMQNHLGKRTPNSDRYFAKSVICLFFLSIFFSIFCSAKKNFLSHRDPI